MIEKSTIDTPIGLLTLMAHGDHVCLLHFGREDEGVRAWLARWYPDVTVRESSDPAGAASALRRYFEGDIGTLDGIAVELNGTPFQKRVWACLRRVRAGTTASYTQLARAAGADKAVRAVGAANGANPVAIIVPCHRVIGADGSLTGYGGGMDRKRWLLQHEGVTATLF
jgi:methylated-DNA-[protein]-cysteine S-methyltransferase